MQRFERINSSCRYLTHEVESFGHVAGQHHIRRSRSFVELIEKEEVLVLQYASHM
jgi:hypothetical protein